MSIDHLDLLHEKLPELFENWDLPTNWHDEFIFVAITDVGKIPDVLAQDVSESAVDNNYSIEKSRYSVYQENLPSIFTTITQALGGSYGGSPIQYINKSYTPPPDCWAFYLPYHHYHPGWWGIYLIYEGVDYISRYIMKHSKGKVSKDQAGKAAQLFLFHHEAFHHQTECFATRFEMILRRPFYKTGFEDHYRKTLAEEKCLEEGLANARALEETYKKLNDKLVDRALAEYVDHNPPSYNQGNRLRQDIIGNRCEFAENNHQECLPDIPGMDSGIWQATSHMFDGIANILSRTNYIIHRNSSYATRIPFHNILTKNRLIETLHHRTGLTFVGDENGQQIYHTASGRVVTIPSHPRDLDQNRIKKILKESGSKINLEEFLQLESNQLDLNI